MRFCWTVDPKEQDFDRILEEVRNGNVRTLQQAVDNAYMSDELKQVLMEGLKKPNMKDFDVFSSEIAACLHYAHKNKNTGKMTKVRKIISKYPDVEKFIIKFYKNEIQKLETTNFTSWFKLRSLCMDIYTLARLLSDDFEVALFYGGAQHATNVMSFLQDGVGCEEVQTNDDILKICENSSLLFFKTIKFPTSSKKITFIGENHSQTSNEFSQKLVDYLESQCPLKKDKKMHFYVEKHVKKTKDENTIPSMLACNMTIPIHKIRCHEVMEKKCSALKRVCVDTRHKDMEFLRFEVFECCEHDPELYVLSQKFIKKALQDALWLVTPIN